jgi:hypothetical protein
MIQNKKLYQIALVITLTLAAAAQAKGQDKPATPAEQYHALVKEFQDATQGHFTPTTTDEERKEIVARADKATVKLLELAEKHPQEPFALEALTQVITQEYWLNSHTSHPGWGKESPQGRAIALLLRDHLQSDQLVETCKRVNFGFRQECETFLRTVLVKNPHPEVRGAACLRLAQLLTSRVEKLNVLDQQPELTRRFETLFGTDFIEGLRSQDRAEMMTEAESFYEQASTTYGDVKLPYGETVGDVARTDLFEIRHLTTGRTAPPLEGTDQDGSPFKLSDYRGKVVLLYFWSEY